MKYRLTILGLLLNSIGFAQNVGIGSVTPIRGKLVVQGVADPGATNAIFGDAEAGISLQQNWPTIGFNQYRDAITPGSYGKRMKTGYSGLLTLSQDNGYLFFESHGFGAANSSTIAASIGIAITPTGNVGIHHGAPNASLDVIRGTAPDGTAAFRGTLYNSHFNYSTAENTYIRGGKSGANVYINDNPNSNFVYIGGGATKVGINTFNTTGAGTLVLRQVGDEGIGLLNDNYGGYRWEINNEEYSPTSQALTLRYSGRATTLMGWFRPTDGGYSDNSDRRLKKNIHTMSPVLRKVMQLTPSNYEFITNQKDARSNIGLIAQDVARIFPELVDIRHLSATGETPIKDLHGMNYSGVSVIAIKAIQEQQQLITDLQKRVLLLEEQNKMLLQFLNAKK